MSTVSSQDRMTMNIATSTFGRDVSSKNAVVLRAGLRKRYIQDTLVRINGETASTSNADWVSSLENSTSFPPRCRAAENDQATGDRKIKWALPDGAVEFVVEKRQSRSKCNHKSRRRRIRRLTDQEKQQLYELRPDLKPEKGNSHADVDLEVRHSDNAIVSFTDAVTKHAVMFSPRALGSFFGNAITHIQDYAYGSSDDDESSESDTSYSDSDSERSESSYSDQSEDDVQATKASQKKSAKQPFTDVLNQPVSVSDLTLDSIPKKSQHFSLHESSLSSREHSSKHFPFDSRISPSNDQISINAEKQFINRGTHGSRPSPADCPNAAERTTTRLKGVALDNADADSVLEDFSRHSQMYYSSTANVNVEDLSPQRKIREKPSRKHRRKFTKRKSSIGEMVTKLVGERESFKHSFETDREDTDVQRQSAQVLMDLVASETFVGLAASDAASITKEISTVFNESSGRNRRCAQRRVGGRRLLPLTEYIKTVVNSSDLSTILHHTEEQEITNAEILDSLEKALDQTPASVPKAPTPRRTKREAGAPTNRLHTVPSIDIPSSTHVTYIETDASGCSTFSSTENGALQHFLKESDSIPSSRIHVSGSLSPTYPLELLAADYEKLDLSYFDSSQQPHRSLILEPICDNDENHQSLSGNPVTEMARPAPVPEQRPPLEVRRLKVTSDLKKKFVFSNYNISNNS